MSASPWKALAAAGVLGAASLVSVPEALAQSRHESPYLRGSGLSIIPGIRFGWQWGSAPNRDDGTRAATPTTATSGTWWEGHLDTFVTLSGNRFGLGLSLGYAGLSMDAAASDANVSLRGPTAMAMFLLSPARDVFVTLLGGAILGGLTDYYPQPRAGLVAHEATTLAFRGGAQVTWAAIASQAIELAFGAGLLYTRSPEVEARAEAGGTTLRTEFSSVSLLLDVTFTFNGSALTLSRGPVGASSGPPPPAVPTYAPGGFYRPGLPGGT